MKKLDQKHTVFIHEYFYGDARGNALAAARKAGYSESTSVKKSATWVGESRKKSTNKTLWDLVQAERQKISAEYGITEKEIMDGYIRESRFDVRKLVNDDGSFIGNLKDLDDDTALALAGVEIEEHIIGGNDDGVVLKRKVKLKLPDKKSNRDSMAKIKGMFAKDNEQKYDPSILTAILSALPDEFADRVKKALISK